MSFRVFSKRNKEYKEFSRDSSLTSFGILVSCIAIYNGKIAPFNGVRSSCEKEERIFVLYSLISRSKRNYAFISVIKTQLFELKSIGVNFIS